MTIPTRQNGENIDASFFNDIKNEIELGVIELQNIISDYTIISTDRYIGCDCTSNAITVDLPVISGNEGRWFYFKRTDSTTSNACTIDADGAELIEGVTTKTLPNQNDATIIVNDGTQWRVISEKSAVLLGKTFDDAITQKEIATPSTPATGYQKIYPKADGSYYQLDDGGIESVLGGGGGGTTFVGFRATAGSGTVSNAGTSIIQYTTGKTNDYDTDSGFNDPTYEYTIPTGEGGKWDFDARYGFAVTLSACLIEILVNGTPIIKKGQRNGNDISLVTCVEVSDTIVVAAGDVIKVRATQTQSGTPQAITTDATYNAFVGSKRG